MEYQYRPEELPASPGSPYAPRHTTTRQCAYAFVSLLLGLCATTGNGLVTTNINALSGSLGLFNAEAGWLSALYVAFNFTANLTLIKARTQFGIPVVTRVLLIGYASCALMQLIFPSGGLAPALVVRASSGLAAAGLNTLTVYYLMQAAPLAVRPAALALGIVIPQLGAPFARQFSVELLAMSSWRGLYLTEFILGLCALLAITVLPLPPTDRKASFEPLDFLTISLILPAAILVSGVLAEGRALWWTDTAWLGWALVAAILLATIAVLIERWRTRPLLRIDWLTSAEMLRFAAVALLVRMALAEQTFGVVGLLGGSRLNNDQFHVLFLIVMASIALGGVAAVVTLSISRLPYQVMTAALMIAFGAWMDSGASNATGPEQLYLSQALLGFGTALFMGPALVYGIGKMLQRGPAFLVSFVVLFSTTQNLGSLVGSALLGTIQVISTRAHVQALSSHLVAGAPQVTARLQSGGNNVAQLLNSVNREALVLAYNDVFMTVSGLALLTALYVLYLIINKALRPPQMSLEK